jgi:hypothetical protein
MLEWRVTFIFVFYQHVFFELVLCCSTASHKLSFSFFFFIFLFSFFILHFLIFKPTCGVRIMRTISCMVNVRDSQYKVVIKYFLKSLWLKWFCWLIHEASNSVLFCLWIHLIAIFDEPLSVLSRLLKIKSSCVKHLFKVYVTFESLNDFSSLIELSDGSLDSNFVSLRDKISLVQQDHISKFDLLTQ